MGEVKVKEQKELNEMTATQLKYLASKFENNEFNYISGGYPQYELIDDTKPGDKVKSFVISTKGHIELDFNRGS
ncbi:MAG: hypothetical protein PHS33_09505 [Candidatus Omnitrophica bacterium]|jgi:exosome complex RNA-binding protein Csl4|nr:hypothetical protein [Candidatus Omnitrophota bacterium]